MSFGVFLVFISFLPRDAIHKRGQCRHAVSVRPSVHLSVRPSVTFVDHVKTNKHVFKMFSPSDSHTILVFPYQTGWRYSDGNPPNGGVECKWGRQTTTRFWTNIWLRCIQNYSVINRTSGEVWKIKAATNGGKRRALTAASVVRCSHKRTTKCLWRARRYTPETKGGQPPIGHNPRFLLPVEWVWQIRCDVILFSA